MASAGNDLPEDVYVFELTLYNCSSSGNGTVEHQYLTKKYSCAKKKCKFLFISYKCKKNCSNIQYLQSRSAGIVSVIH